MPDAIELLKEQHAEVAALLAQIERARGAALRRSIFRSIDAALRTHSAIEERIFYPAFRERGRSDWQSEKVAEALHEHDEIKSALEALERTGATEDAFKQKLQSLKSAVQRHVNEEESGMLKQARGLFTREELDDLAFRMEQAAAQTSPVYEMASVPR